MRLSMIRGDKITKVDGPRSLGDRERNIRAQVEQMDWYRTRRSRGGVMDTGAWPTDIYEDFVVVSFGDKYYRHDYEMEHGKPEVAATRTEVVRRWIPAKDAS